VLLLVAERLSNAEIAVRIVVSESTVKTHVANLLAKLAALDRIGLAVVVHRHAVRATTP
jgi:DNA-binding NarL/FixJ family response regulator